MMAIRYVYRARVERKCIGDLGHKIGVIVWDDLNRGDGPALRVSGVGGAVSLGAIWDGAGTNVPPAGSRLGL